MTLPRTLAQARSELDEGRVTSVDLVAAVQGSIDARESIVRALVCTTYEMAMEQAVKADARIAAGERTPLLGIPLVVKDLVDVAGVPTTAGSKVLADNVPTDSSVVWSRLEAAGAVLIGKANTHEFAYGGTTEPTRNPADTSRIVGGSSGGPAAALAAAYCLGAVGTDTAGSIRIPANLCGVPALKPTRGLVPSGGVVPLSQTLDVVGPMARSVADLAPLLSVMAAIEAGPASRPRSVGLLQGTLPEAQSVSRAVADTVAVLRRLGIEVVDVELPGFAESVFDDFTVIGYEATVIHQQWKECRHLYTPYVRERLAAAAEVTRQQYDDALCAGERLGLAVDDLLEQVDVLLLPGVPFPASPAYDEQVDIDGQWEDRDTGLCRNTAFANLTGHPVLALPAGLDGLLPVGVQLVGRRGADFDLVDLGSHLEALLPPGLPPALRD